MGWRDGEKRHTTVTEKQYKIKILKKIEKKRKKKNMVLDSDEDPEED